MPHAVLELTIFNMYEGVEEWVPTTIRERWVQYFRNGVKTQHTIKRVILRYEQSVYD